ncbi:hypothetical protein AKO1_010705, partial [Acrasis kona]
AEETKEDKISRIRSQIEQRLAKVKQVQQVLAEIKQNGVDNLSFEKYTILRPILNAVIDQQEPSPKRRKTSHSLPSASTSTFDVVATPPTVEVDSQTSTTSTTRKSNRKRIPSLKASETTAPIPRPSPVAIQQEIIVDDESSRDSRAEERERDQIVASQSQAVQKQTYVLCGTVLNKEQASELDYMCRKMGAKLSVKMTPQVTHVITPVDQEYIARRTMKFSSGIVCGAWIVGFPWVQKCIEQLGFVDEVDYEVRGDHTAVDGPKLGRLAKNNASTGILSNLYIYLHGQYKSPNPSKSELTNLVKWGGATVLKQVPREEELTKKSDSKKNLSNTIVIVDGDVSKEDIRSLSKTSGCNPLKFAWLLDSVSAYQLKDRQSYVARSSKK